MPRLPPRGSVRDDVESIMRFIRTDIEAHRDLYAAVSRVGKDE